MSDVLLESLRAILLAGIAAYLWRIGRRRPELSRQGLRFVIGGFSLLLFGSLLDITDNFDSLNEYVVIGDTETQAF
jgi:hypothetical protein